MTITRLITHSGAFHADDLFAYAVLNGIFPDAQIERTRDEKTLSEAGAEAIVFDVGGIYDPEANRFDHHQPGRPMREEGLAYSAFGLIWKHYGKALLGKHGNLTPEAIEIIHEKIDQGLVRDIDAVDNGQIQPGQEGATHPLSIASMIGDLRPPFDNDDPAEMDECFALAAKVIQGLLYAKIGKAAEKLRSRRIVEEAIAARKDPRWIELPRGMGYQGPILDMGEAGKDILFVLYPANQGSEWQINVVNVAHGSYEARKPLPAAWAGLRGDDLSGAAGVPDAVFCHLQRFIAIAGSRGSALKMLEQALAA